MLKAVNNKTELKQTLESLTHPEQILSSPDIISGKELLKLITSWAIILTQKR